ncbi:phosphoribosylglycinamide formyltransferase [Thiohalomonas denitrificans]|uniref:Phosphoribosylglycinamide formyltransferase n=1 Tax=Thiohalomonas denitrificans TaxID=415747 RepID=A0A1G5QM68_9GAMM|nr:phosphoribosylglycinamide formyltransferase [Thiohalomonas denitrificans]SCZ62827.1 phosphoribosylglycinamide formyltransferase-1 [Thiohalomonas denitrificans]
MSAKLPIVVLISGGGTNLQSIIDAVREGLPVEIRAVISNRADAFGLERARRAGIPTEVVEHRQFADRESYDAALMECIDRFQPGLVVLAGFMRILSNDFVRHYHGRMLNIHPSLLPRHRGLNTHSRCLDAGDTEHGASVHFVTPELDAGPIILQARVPVEPDDSPETLASRVLAQEHRIYPQAIRWYAEGRLKLKNGHALLDGEPVQCR